MHNLTPKSHAGSVVASSTFCLRGLQLSQNFRLFALELIPSSSFPELSNPRFLYANTSLIQLSSALGLSYLRATQASPTPLLWDVLTMNHTMKYFFPYLLIQPFLLRISRIFHSHQLPGAYTQNYIKHYHELLVLSRQLGVLLCPTVIPKETCQWFNKMYGSQNMFDDTGSNVLKVTEEVNGRGRNYRGIQTTKSSSFFYISALALIMHCRKFIVFSDILHWVLNFSSLFSSPCLLIYPPSSLWVSVLSLDTCKSTVSSLAKNCFYILCTIIGLNVTAFLPNRLWFTALRERN